MTGWLSQYCQRLALPDNVVAFGTQQTQSVIV
ncbi:hypothetical protein GGI64_006502 [Rhizobium leguminosarum]|uniref:Uncharacterized protein n=1 Tax=Rhizobium leguminosarum TaxID=384 RepID=A0A7W9ZPG9_RHILE|nr:hypothetical protein [Rhizobium leguminosarum]NYJ15395.1 hypothetical protein [Rhizobium leguminosarum]